MGINDGRPPKDLAPRLQGLALADVPVPNGREEEWRFTPMARLRGLHEAVPATGTADWTVTAPVGVTTATAPVEIAGYLAADRISIAALTHAKHALIVEVPKEFSSEEPIVIALAGGQGVTYSHLRLVAGKYSKASFVVDTTGSGTHGITLELVTEDGSNTTLIQIADGDRDQVIAGQHHVRVGRDATVQHIVVTLGGDVVRLVTSAQFDGPGGGIDALGVFFTDAGQHHEHRLFMDHNAPNCRSNVAYKGALQGDDAHAVWIGDVLIRANAVGTETYEINRNLVLTEGARADSVPNLEIETGNVLGAGHASATGRFDEEQMFYLTSRGIPEVEARRLVVRGFISENVQKIPVTEIRERLLRRVEQRLGAHDPRYDFEDHA